MTRISYMAIAATFLFATPSIAQTGEDRSAKSDITNRSGNGGSTGGPSRNASDGADPNVMLGSTTTMTHGRAPSTPITKLPVRNENQAIAATRELQRRQKASRRTAGK